MVSTRTSPGPGGSTVSARSVAVRGAVNHRALAFSSSPIRDTIWVFDASAEDKIHPVRFHRDVGEGERSGQVAYTKVADSFYAFTQRSSGARSVTANTVPWAAPSASTAALGGVRRVLSTTTRRGLVPGTCRTVRRGSSLQTVPTPTRTASLEARISWAKRRDSGQ